jgi:hypothetical protein
MWSYIIKEISEPSLTVIRIRFNLLKDDVNHVTDQIEVSPTELEGKTNQEKLVYIKTKIEDRCADYIITDNVFSGLKVYEGTVVNL